MVGEEDCLTLNIFNKFDNSSTLKPVMFWVHGGGLSIGSSSEYGPTPLVKEGVLVVTINYRLGSLGFLTMGNDLAPGNLGIRDQIQALAWVNTLIHYFGGDPSKVTIFGESAGGMSTHALTLTPKAYNMFNAAIYESGTMLFFRQKYETSAPQRASAAVAEYFNCSSTNYDSEMLSCLQNVPHEALLAVTSEGVDIIPDIIFFPTVDKYSSDPVFPVDYLTAMKTGYFNKVPIMTGTMKNEGLLSVPEYDLNKDWEKEGPKNLFIQTSFNASEVTDDEILQAQLMKRFYTGKRGNLNDSIVEFYEMLTDSMFLSPDQKVAELASKYVPVYNYRLTYAGEQSLLPFYLGESLQLFDEQTIAKLKPVHADELFYLFDYGKIETEDDLQMRDIMVKYWTNFAKYGHPSPLMSDNITQWLPYSAEKNYMVLNLEPEMKQQVEKERMEFWQRVHWQPKEEEINENESILSTPFNFKLLMKPFNPILRLFSGY